MTKPLRAELWEGRLLAGQVVDIESTRENKLLSSMIDATNQRLPRFCEPFYLERMGCISISLGELEVTAGADMPHATSGLPARFFFGMGHNDELYVSGTVEGTQAYGIPFVGYIETQPDLRSKGHASRLLPILNSISKRLYDQPLSSGPGHYLSDNGRALQDSHERTYDLQQNHQGFVIGQ